MFSITRGLGTSLSLDDHTMRKNRGLFARVLVDIDLLSPLPDHLLVKCPNFAFAADVEYEWLSPFCYHCKMIGHDLPQCRVIHDQIVFLDLNINLLKRQLLMNGKRGRSRFLNNVKNIKRKICSRSSLKALLIN